MESNRAQAAAPRPARRRSEGYQLPATEPQLERAVKIMAKVHTKLLEKYSRSIEMRKRADDQRKQAVMLQESIRQEAAMRRRMEDYIAYWQPKVGYWTDKELWDRPVKMKKATDGNWYELDQDGIEELEEGRRMNGGIDWIDYQMNQIRNHTFAMDAPETYIPAANTTNQPSQQSKHAGDETMQKKDEHSARPRDVPNDDNGMAENKQQTQQEQLRSSKTSGQPQNDEAVRVFFGEAATSRPQKSGSLKYPNRPMRPLPKSERPLTVPEPSQPSMSRAWPSLVSTPVEVEKRESKKATLATPHKEKPISVSDTDRVKATGVQRTSSKRVPQEERSSSARKSGEAGPSRPDRSWPLYKQRPTRSVFASGVYRSYVVVY
ncbi:uncharacterized protein LAESUDRAFT_227323 [Laetiporus sulphureus 93-53]|uniref:Uncharacterized protein n=1 Tax=Laetiporus sulphureus 93-53 TaxID=1314785 RepID=A0A165DPY2_9APHY|nr:uncharacterized protein LAESUDRAFT_227323 [Laetiporus sulphureus 93-53]KZT05368.1 hypothetical protein LAESUDRAFT_227323 [Laetiporus sulphureus 93-53]